MHSRLVIERQCLGIGLLLAWGYRRWAKKKFEATGIPRSMFWTPLAVVELFVVLTEELGIEVQDGEADPDLTLAGVADLIAEAVKP